MKTLNTTKAKQLFESYYGRKIAIASWYRLLKVFDAELPLTVDNVKFVAEVKKLVPKFNPASLKAIHNLKQTRGYIAKSNYQITGEEVLRLLKEHNIEPHPNTLTKWFKPLEGFNRSKYYSLSELMPVFIIAHTYALKKQLKEAAYFGIVKG